MAVATTTAAIIAAGIGAAGTAGGAALSSRASNRASDASERSTNRALDFEREREASRKAEYDRSMADYRRQWDAWNSMRMGLMQRYGAQMGGQTGRPRLTLGALADGPGMSPSMSQQPRRRMTLGDF